MASTAFMTQYRDEFIAGFEQNQSLLRDSVTTEAVISGNTAVFLVADSGSAEAVTRGVNGLIPSRPDNLTQNSCTLEEWHDKPTKTGFNVFASQGDQRAIMQRTSMGVINRKMDSQIITQLNTATNDTGSATTGSLRLFTKAKTILGVNSVPWDGNITALITPALEGYLLETAEFGSAKYVDGRPLQNGQSAWSDMPKMYQWIGMNLIVHPNLPGVGTNAEKCFLYHKSAIGHAINKEGIKASVGYNEEDDYSWALTTMYGGAKLLQNSGVVVINHDGSAFAAS